MTTTYADVQDGERIDIVVEFVTRRPVEHAGERVHRLVFADATGEQFPVLVAPDGDPLVDVETGRTYRIEGLLGTAPVVEPGAVAAACPDCGGRLRTAGTVDAVEAPVRGAASRLGLVGPFGVVDAETTVERAPEAPPTELGGAGPVDDWIPAGGPAGASEFVCESCEHRVGAGELRDDHGFAGVFLEDGSFGDGSFEGTSFEDAFRAPADPETAGLAAGGAKGTGGFRENVERGYTPPPEDISDEGLFYDYHFETGERSDIDALFAPSFAAATSEHPITGATERYVSVGLDSTLPADDFERPSLDLVVVLDVSGSMDSPVDAYHYDDHEGVTGTDAPTKLQVATESLCALTEQLHDDERLGVVLCNHRAHVAKPLRAVRTTDAEAIRRHVRDVAAGGSTNLADGFEAAAEMLADGAPDPGVERRVLLVTDVMPNAGATADDLVELFEEAAVEGIHTTFVGTGLDANAELAAALSGVRGANYYSVHSAAEFERRLDEEFDCMVTPLVYDLDIELATDGWEIDAVHGSPRAEAATDRLVHVGTLFPSAGREGRARGGVVLVRLERVDPDAELDLVASWTERDGDEYADPVTLSVPETPETFAHDGVRKAVALARYARELRAWARDVHERAARETGVERMLPDRSGQHERKPVPLVVPDRYAERFDRLREYLEDEADAVGDERLRREADLLARLCRQTPSTATDRGPTGESD